MYDETQNIVYAALRVDMLYLWRYETSTDSFIDTEILNVYLELNILICKLNCFNTVYKLSFKEHLTEDGRNSWPKHVAGYAVYTTIGVHICMCTGWSCCS